MVRVKFCGMRNLADCEEAIRLSVDYVGFVFYEKSPRYVAPATVRGIVESLKGRVQTVGVFVDQDDRAIREVMTYCRLDYAQVYRPTAVPNRIRVVRVAGTVPEVPTDREGFILFDTHSEGYGGSGRSFDPRLLEGCGVLDRAFVAGGVNLHNVDALLRLNPFGIDLVSSIERCKGKKDHRKMEEFMKKVRSFSL